MRRSLVAALAAALMMVLAVTGVAAADGGGRPLSTALTGAEEAPGPGDANATGQAELRLTLFTGSFAGTDSVSGCAEDVDAELIKAIRHDPTAYYVNVHSRPNFPGGAVRGQLGD